MWTVLATGWMFLLLIFRKGCNKYTVPGKVQWPNRQRNKHCHYRCKDSMPNLFAVRVLKQKWGIGDKGARNLWLQGLDHLLPEAWGLWSLWLHNRETVLEVEMSSSKELASNLIYSSISQSSPCFGKASSHLNCPKNINLLNQFDCSNKLAFIFWIHSSHKKN